MTACLEMNVEDLQESLKSQTVVILDVRTDEEYQISHLPSVHIPLQELTLRLDELPKEQSYAVICRAGGRSAQATMLMLDAGFKQVVNVAGGMTAWQARIDPNMKVG